ncbi:MAG: NADH-quinone oxidoreductase subunit C [Ferruginibacter sp.]|nr:NADH-quinone oxidoreductase subunit C [Ferruginibacter sp.]
MDKEELKIKISKLLPTAVYEDGGDWLNIIVDSNKWLSYAAILKNDGSLLFDYLFCLTCIDWKTHLTMVYHLSSTKYRYNIVVKSNLDINTPKIETVSQIWQTANFHEREVYEMFGVNFLNHKDLRLLILPDGWEGKNPLRKDFEDLINMIKL